MNELSLSSEYVLDISAIRNDFPILGREMNAKPLVFLDSAASSQKPYQVIQAISKYYEHTHANVHRGVYQLSQEATDAFEQSRKSVRSFINAASEQEVIFVRGCTEGINLVASSFGRKFLEKGDVILLSEMEHHSNIVPWQLIAEERGAEIKVIPVNDEGELDMDAFKSMLHSMVKIVAVTHVSNALGTINPVKWMISEAHSRNIPVLIDGAQSAPHMELDVQDLDADFYVFSAHKMYGPTGMGVLYGKKEWLNQMPPYHGGGEMIDRVTFEKTTFNELPFKFEAGTPNIAGAVGLDAAIQYMNSIGVARIQQHEHQLLLYGQEQLSKVDGIKFIGTAQDKAGVISFLVEGTHPYDVGTLLDKQGIAVRTGHHCTQPLMDRYGIPGTIRASFGVYNTFEDIDKLTVAVQKSVAMLR